MEVGWSILGSLDAIVDGHRVTPSGRRPAEVLAVLLLHRNYVVTQEELIDQLWPDDPPASARNSVQRFVADLRKLLGPGRGRLLTEAGGYRLVVEAGELDLDRVERQLDSIRTAPTGEPTDVFSSLQNVGDVLARRLCPGAERLAAVENERIRLAALRVMALEAAGDVALDAGLDVAQVLTRWVAQDPLNERLTAQLMKTLARSGHQAEALAAFGELRRRLRDDLGVSPSPALAALELDILEQRETTQPDRRSAPRGEPDLIGRDADLATIVATLDEAKLVTLTGPGGVGKTSLALAAARLTSAPWLGAVHTAFLGDVSGRALFIDTVAAAIGVDLIERPAIDQVVSEAVRLLASEPCLLVIDNAEHLIAEVAEFVTAVSASPGGSRILVTSRQPLAVAGERVIEVEPLPIEEAAVELFALRAAEASDRDSDDLTGDPMSAQICRSIDGLPLAIELAAAQLSMVTLEELAERIDRPMRVLGGRRTPSRQSSLDALLTWSWDLLNDGERRLLTELSVFREWPLEAAEHLDPERGFVNLAALVSRSLVRVRVGSDGRSRYSLLETVRDYARHQLDQQGRRTEAEADHARWMLAAARRFSMAEALMAADAHEYLEREAGNLLVALAWLADHGCRRDFFDLLARAGGLFSHRGPLLEGLQWFARGHELMKEEQPCPEHGVVHRDDVDTDLRGAILAADFGVAIAKGDLIRMMSSGIEASAIADDGSTAFDWAPSALGLTALSFETATLDGEAQHLMDRAERMAPNTDSPELNRAVVEVCRGNWEQANRRYEEAIELYDRSLEPTPIPGRVLLLAESGKLLCLHLLGRHDEARALADGARSSHKTDAWHYGIDIARAVAIGPSDPAAAARLLEEVLGSSEEDALPGRREDVRIATAVVAWAAGDRERCVELLDGAVGRTPGLVGLLVEYIDGTPNQPMDAVEWRTRWRVALESRFAERPRETDGWTGIDGPNSPVRVGLAASLKALAPG